MCANYQPVTHDDRLLTFFGVERRRDEAPPEIGAEAWPLGLAPFIRLHEAGSGGKVIETGQFGLLPGFAKEVTYGRKTYNARSETVHELNSFRESWARGRRCIIPAEAVYEQCYESGLATRWLIQQPGAIPLGIAGIYRRWKAPDGRLTWTFAMLTVNAAGHPVYERLHAPGEEKRMIVVLEPAEYDRWLQCSPHDARAFFRQWPHPLEAFPAPNPLARKKTTKPLASGRPDQLPLL